MSKKPYSKAEIGKIPCARCGKPSKHQWQICSLNNEYRGVCTDCDLALNILVLKYFKVPNREEVAKEYAKKMLE